MSLSDDARTAVGGALGDMAPSTDEWRDHCTDYLSQAVMDAVLPDGRTIAQALDALEEAEKFAEYMGESL